MLSRRRLLRGKERECLDKSRGMKQWRMESKNTRPYLTNSEAKRTLSDGLKLKVKVSTVLVMS